MLTVIVILTGNICVVFTCIVTITGRSICSVNRYYDENDKNGEVYMQC